MNPVFTSLPTSQHWIVFALLLSAIGCNAESSTQNPRTTPLPETETWGVIFVNGKKIGYQHFKRSHTKVDNEVLVKVEHATKMRLLRFGTTAEIEVEQSATETADGTLVEFETRMKTGAGAIKTIGKVQDNRLWIRQGKQPDTSLTLADGIGSFAAVDHSLERDPLEAGESRTIQQVEPSLASIVKVELHAKDWESTDLLSGTFKLLRIDGSMTMPDGTALPLELWADADGQTLKTITKMGALDQTSYRTTKEVALAPAEGASFDLGRATTVPSDKALPGIHHKSHAHYRVRLKAAGSAKDFAENGGQSVKQVDPKTVEIVVKAMRPASKPAVTDDKPTED